jgi:hypothetical protein
VHQEQLLANKDDSYAEVLSICVKYAKHDKTLMMKLRECKFKHSDNTQATLGNKTNMSGEDDTATNCNLI